MELEPIGRFADPDELDVDPITVPIVGYTVEGRKEIITRIKFVPAVPLGATFSETTSVVRPSDLKYQAKSVATYFQPEA